MSNLEYLQKIAENQTGRTTWIAKYKGTKCIAKKITVDKTEKKAVLIQQLNGQVTYSDRLSGADRQRIILFNQMIEDDDAVVFLRDFVDGESLNNLIANKLDWKEAIKWMKQIAAIVQISHDKYNVIHGDLKPANILQRKSDKSLCIIDWDTMRISDQVESMLDRTLSITDIVSPEYMSPEQCAGKKCDYRTDVYSLGVILYHLLTGDFPFTGSAMEIISKKQQETLPPFLNRFPILGVPVELGKLIDDSLQKDENKRIGNITEFIERLNRIDIDKKQDLSTPSPNSTQIPNNTSQGTVQTPQRPIGKKTKDDSSIVIIGPTQSGKTVLAAGLYRSHSSNFNVSALDDKTRQYADQIGSFLQSGNWPAATSKNEVIKLIFKLDIKDWTGTRSGIVEFKEYSGEHMRKENYYQEIIGDNPEVVLMLFNPGTPWIADAYPNKLLYKSPSEINDAAFRRNEFISQMKGCINYMVSLPNPPAIALVVTAADRLKSDLKPYKEDFDHVLSEICDALTLNKCVWKRFDVSVCKALEKQEELVFNPQHIHDPFVWALNRKRLGRYIKWASITATTLISVFLVCFAIFWIGSTIEKRKGAQLEHEFTLLEAAQPNRGTSERQKEYVEKLDNIIKKRGAYIFYFDWFNKYTKDYEESKTKVNNKLIEENLKLFEMRFEDINKIQGDEKTSKKKIKDLEKLQNEMNSYVAIPKNGEYRNRFDKDKKNIDNAIEVLYGGPFENLKQKIKGASAVVALDNLKDWILENADNQNIEEAERIVYDIVIKEMDEYINKCLKEKDNQSDYIKLKDICRAVKSTNSEFIKKQNTPNAYTFANRYFEWYENEEGRKYTLNVIIYGKSSYSNGGYVNGDYNHPFYKDWSKKIEKSSKLEPWKEFHITIHHSIAIPWDFDPEYSCDFNFHPKTIEVSPQENPQEKNSRENSFKIEYTVTGVLIGDLVDQFYKKQDRK